MIYGLHDSSDDDFFYLSHSPVSFSLKSINRNYSLDPIQWNKINVRVEKLNDERADWVSCNRSDFTVVFVLFVHFNRSEKRPRLYRI